jgi:alkylation response protein AidB-like acyl-CoA dehydrogenase
MDLCLSDQETLLQQQIRDLLKNEVTFDTVREAEASGELPRSLWAALGSQGWFGLPVSEAKGGSGGTMAEWMLLLEEMGRVAFPGPVAEQGTAAVYLAGPAAGAVDGMLPSVLSGERIVSIGMEDAPGAPTAVSSGRISGEKILLPYGSAATTYLVSAAVDGAAGYAAVERGQTAVTVRAMETMSSDQQVRARFDGASAAALGRAGAEPGKDLRGLYTLAKDAFCVGLMGRMLEIATNYARDRVQFGRPIGSFQAVAHRCADMALAHSAAQVLVYQAAWLIGEGRPSAVESAMAHAYVRDAAGECVSHSHQVHGAIGFTAEYPLGLFSRRAKAYQHSLGRASEHREVVAAAIGTPALVR